MSHTQLIVSVNDCCSYRYRRNYNAVMMFITLLGHFPTIEINRYNEFTYKLILNVPECTESRWL